MLLPELKVDFLARRILTRLLDIPRRDIRPTKVHPDIRPQRALQPPNISPINNPIPHPAKQSREIRAPKIRTSLELGKRILVRTNAVQHNVLRGIGVHFLSQVGVDAEELVAVCARGLGFEGEKQIVDPFERVGVFADPDEFDAAETLGRVGALS